jgi:hypothetical protein
MSNWLSHSAARVKAPVDEATSLGPATLCSFNTIQPQALAIQGPGVIGSIWPDWVILLYVIGAEVTVE